MKDLNNKIDTASGPKQHNGIRAPPIPSFIVIYNPPYLPHADKYYSHISHLQFDVFLNISKFEYLLADHVAIPLVITLLVHKPEAETNTKFFFTRSGGLFKSSLAQLWFNEYSNQTFQHLISKK